MSVVFYKDKDCEMLCVEVDGDVVYEGNFWDFDFSEDAPELLKMLGVDCKVENYKYQEEQ